MTCFPRHPVMFHCVSQQLCEKNTQTASQSTEVIHLKTQEEHGGQVIIRIFFPKSLTLKFHLLQTKGPQVSQR